MKLLICGGRDYVGYHALEEAMKLLPFKITCVVHGDARGADSMGKMWAMSNGIWAVAIPALWDAHGKGAGPKRNQAMLDIMKPDYCVALPGGNGTADMVKRCKDAGVPVWEPFRVEVTL